MEESYFKKNAGKTKRISKRFCKNEYYLKPLILKNLLDNIIMFSKNLLCSQKAKEKYSQKDIVQISFDQISAKFVIHFQTLRHISPFVHYLLMLYLSCVDYFRY